ncbi:MAG: LPXTG cell wall anchor domain-containing protein [Actinomycetota bacterium]
MTGVEAMTLIILGTLLVVGGGYVIWLSRRKEEYGF